MINDLDTEVRPGDGVAARLPGTAMLILPGDGHAAGTSRLVELVRLASVEHPPAGRRLARRLAATLAASDGDDTPPFALVADDPGGVVVFVHGPLRVDVDVDGSEPISVSGALSATWADRVVAAPVSSIRLGAAPAADDGHPVGLRYTLREGVVPAGEMYLAHQHTAAPAEPATAPVLRPAAFPPPVDAHAVDIGAVDGIADQTAEDAAPDDRAPVAPSATFVPLAGAGEVRQPLPVATDAPDAVNGRHDDVELVEGILCSREHVNDPAASYCSSCGISLVHRTHNLVVGPRPPLGILVFDDGSIYNLDRGYVVGREPDDDPKVVDGTFRPLAIDDPDRSISRVHAEIVLEGWDVRVIDRGSTNGTFVFDAEQERWTQLAPGVAHTVGPSTRLGFGSRTLVFETPHRAPADGAAVRRLQPARGAT